MVVIVGAGIAGLAIGWYLARAGCPVTVLDRAEAGRAATWAAAGMLAPHAEAKPGDEGLLGLLLASHAAWAGFAHALEAASGMYVDYRTGGTLMVANGPDDGNWLKFHHRLQCRLGLDVQELSGYQARQREPHLAPTVTAALFCPLDGQVDNRKVALALRGAFLSAGGLLREHSPVDEVLIAEGRVRGVRLKDEQIAAETVILAAGAWSRNLGGLPAALRPPIRPIKGQMLALQMPPAAPLIEHVVWGPEVYLVPRVDGRLLVGATVEEQGFDVQTTAGGLYGLLRGAREVLPGIDDLPVVETWAGLRPGSRDNAPILGDTSVRGLVMATGHYRNGILLAPLTAQAISRLVLEGTVMEEMKPFGLERFS
ncbi:MAG: glycine oxidase ThiO [Chloroflexota bacterium]